MQTFVLSVEFLFKAAFALMLCVGLAGCGSGGYPGGGILELSQSAFTIDAGQSIPVSAVLANSPRVTWSLPGTTCSANGCGALSSTTGAMITYTAPAGMTTPIKVVLTAAVSGTKNQSSTTITVNPLPTISGTLPNGVVGAAYSGSLLGKDGTAPLKWSIVDGALPAGLTFNTANGTVTGMPTVSGTFGFKVQITDASYVPYTVSAQEFITINAPVSALSIVGTIKTSGVTGTAYSSSFQAAGGVTPYTWSIASGSLPPSITLNPATGAIIGVPTTQGTYSFMAQVRDAANSVAAAPYTITITAGSAMLTLTNPPNGTVNVPYTGMIGVTGGVGPYTCTITAGALPAGLVLGSNCVVTGTPTTAGTSTVTIKATDSGTGAGTGPVVFTIGTGVTISLSNPPPATVNVPYTGTIGVTGGTGPYTCSITSGTLPAGLTLGANCVITGTPTAPGTATVIVKGTDSGGNSGTGPVTITVGAGATLTLSNPPSATVNVPYTGTIGVAGGAAPYACTITGGSLPAGLTLGANCVISGTPTTAGTTTVTVNATDSGSGTGTGPVSLTVAPASATLTLSNPQNGIVNVPYTGSIGVTGGTAPYACTIKSGSLPAGLTLGANCGISGTPTTAGTSVLTVMATDSGSGTITGQVSLTIAPATILTLSNPPGATVNVPYTGTIGVAGGTAPYACTITSGSLPAGLTLGANCVISGTPTTAGTSTVVVNATDSGSGTGSGPVSLTVSSAAATLTLSNPPNGTVNVPYTGVIGVTGGTAPYACTITSGTLPAGLTLGANCGISGTPTTAGTSMLTVRATDSASGMIAGPVSLTIAPAAAVLTLSNPPNGTVNVPYTGTIGVAGGAAPYTCTITSGSLPAGLSLGANCGISGTPTTAGTSTVTVSATDSGSGTGTGPVSITISTPTLVLTLSNPPNGTVNVPYTGVIGVAGGTAPYACTITSGTLPAGLTLGASCGISGTPTTAGTSTVTVKANDSGTATTTGPVSITIGPATTLTLSNPPNATVNVPYTGVIGVAGGTAPYACTITSGTLSAGLTLGANCSISGTPTTAGTSTITVKATDSGSGTITGPVSLTVAPAAATLTLSNPPNGTVNVPYTGMIGVMGGTAPYACMITGGTLPAGLTLGANCLITGTPATAGTSVLTVKATDSASGTTTGPVSLTISPVPTLTLTGTLPNGVVNQPYSQTLAATGGISPYTYAITAGALPAGLTLSTTGTISGTPTVVGASSFTVTATDSEGTPQTASLPLILLIKYASGPNDSWLTGPYAFLFQGYDDALLGVLSYKTASAGSFTSDGAGVLSAGEYDANHQASNPTGNTVSTTPFLGTYEIGADGRGSMTFTPLRPDGTTGSNITFAIAVKRPATTPGVSQQASFIEFDDNQLAGTRGSGTILAQQTTAFSAGINGSYAFGLEGDTPCLPSCAIGIFAGPVAQVGQFANGPNGTITGTGDANIANSTYVNAGLTGSFGTADANGRLQVTLNTAGTSSTIYPTDFAVYIVDANRALLVSTDKHSSYILLAGSAQLQTQATFSNASIAPAFIGYENSQVNPELIGTLLQNTLNVSTATVFRSVGTTPGACTITNLDQGGLTSLVNNLTGILGNLTTLNLLGTYESTGPIACTVSSNGRGVLNYPAPSGPLAVLLGLLGLSTKPPAPRTLYLSSPSTGYFLETGYAGLGHLEAQTPVQYSNATFNGTFIYSNTTAATAVGLNTSGLFVPKGDGTATSTLDLSLGVGTLNLLQLGTTGTSTYSVTDTTAGRYQLNGNLLNGAILNGTNVVYAIAPGRFVLVDTNPLTTSPSVTLLY